MNCTSSETERPHWDQALILAVASHALMFVVWYAIFTFVTELVCRILADGSPDRLPWPTKFHLAVSDALCRFHLPILLAVAGFLVAAKGTDVLLKSRGPAAAHAWTSWVTLGMIVLILVNIGAIAAPWIHFWYLNR